MESSIARKQDKDKTAKGVVQDATDIKSQNAHESTGAPGVPLFLNDSYKDLWLAKKQHQMEQAGTHIPKQVDGGCKLPKKRNKDLPAETQDKMESAFGEDFSDVKIHSNSNEASMLNARAFTQGNEIHFASGEFDPISKSGQEILGHELSHVTQQRSGLVKGTHVENDYVVSNEETLETRADKEGQKAARGDVVKRDDSTSIQKSSSLSSVQKKYMPIQMWRDVPGQARVESTAPNTSQAWNVFMRAARQSAGGHASKAEPELRRRYYNLISQRLRGSFSPINVDAHTTGGFNHHWVGTIRFVFGDSPMCMPGGGAGTTSISNVSQSSNALESSATNAVGSSGGAEGTFTPGEGGGAGGSVSAGGEGSSSSGLKDTQGDTQTAGSTSQINQNLERYSTNVGIEVNITASYDMGSSWSDWVNPAAYGAYGMAAAITGSGSATGGCGTVIYYEGAGIAGSSAGNR